MNKIVELRAPSHGSYGNTSFTAQALKNVFRRTPNWSSLSTQQRESLDMIATKISRILSGNPNEPDHWVDIIGYAELVSNKLEDE